MERELTVAEARELYYELGKMLGYTGLLTTDRVQVQDIVFTLENDNG